MMNWEINTEGGNNHIGSGKLDGNGIPADFFSNIHVRRAFVYCFNFDAFQEEIYPNEVEYRADLLMLGMPGYRENQPQYAYNPEQCVAEIKQAYFNGNSVWDKGFRFSIAYNTGNKMREAFVKILQNEFSSLNSNFLIEAKGLASTDYSKDLREQKIPVFSSAWIEDIHDPHNIVIPFTTGIYAIRQSLPEELRDQFGELILQGVQINDPARRAEIYQQLTQLYSDQAIAIVLFQDVDRYYQQRWVQGRFCNLILPGLYLYPLYKE